MTDAIPLRTTALSRLPADVRVPRYDRRLLVPSVVHISVGSFHRSHQAVYFDELAQLGERGWGITGVGLRRPEMRAALAPQDGLYTVVSRGHGRDTAHVVGAIRRYLLAPEDDERVVASLADARTRLVTLTITAGGYEGTAIDLIVRAMRRRRRLGRPPFTVLSCDNMPANGEVARDAVLLAAGRRDPDLAAWIAEHGAFPSSMVDRITPKTTDADRALVARQFGIADRWPVITEPFSQWVIEDRFSHGRPPLDRVGVQFVDDVRPYALLKTRMLNASHCALGHLGLLAGHERADAAVGDPVFAAYLDRMMESEVAPLLPAVAGVDLDEYRRTVLERMANPKLSDPLVRLCRAASGKVPRHVVPSIVTAREQGRPHELLTLALAGWFRHLRGLDDRGRPMAIDDPLAPLLQERLRGAGTDPRPLLRDASLFGALADDEDFAATLEDVLVEIDRHGTRAVVQSALGLESVPA